MLQCRPRGIHSVLSVIAFFDDTNKTSNAQKQIKKQLGHGNVVFQDFIAHTNANLKKASRNIRMLSQQ